MDATPWAVTGRRLTDAGVPFLPFNSGGVGLPFYLYPEHRDLDHWRAVNDPGPPQPTRPTHGGYPTP